VSDAPVEITTLDFKVNSLEKTFLRGLCSSIKHCFCSLEFPDVIPKRLYKNMYQPKLEIQVSRIL